MNARLALGLCLVTAGCKKPPEAPKELEDLCAYLFEHGDDAEEEAVEEGIANLGEWLEGGTDQLSEGYTINNITQDALDALDDRERDANAVLGAAISSESDLALDSVVQQLILGDQEAIYPETYSHFERSFVGDPECFVDHECPDLEFHNESTATLPLGINIDCQHKSQDRWVAWNDSEVLLHRSWLVDPAKGGILSLNAQYFLAITFPWNGETLRLQALWADAEVIGANVPQATMLNMLVTNLQDIDADLYDYARAHD